MTLIIVLVLVVFLTDGSPIATVYTLPATANCDEVVATRYARDFASQFPDVQIQGEILWNCAPVDAIGPGPAMQPALYPGLTDAAE